MFELFEKSRTAVITISTFFVVGITFYKLYGGYAVGIKKSKDIIVSLTVATVLSDIVTFFQLYIMSKYAANFMYLITIIIIQFVCINIFVYIGNYVFFLINPPEKSLIIYGDNSTVESVMTKISKYKKQWKIVGIVQFSHQDLTNTILKHNSVFLVGIPRDVTSSIIEYCYKNNINAYIIPELSDVIINNSRHVLLDDTIAFTTSIYGLTFEQKVVKRLIDFIFAFIAICFTLPIMIIIAIAIKLEDGGPIFFRQKRMTINSRIFKVLKFRSMKSDEKLEKEVNPTTNDDERITKVGRIIRRFRVDELPQFFNILFGDMSVVGPRPERLEHIELYTNRYPEFAYRLRVKAGLTGLAQILGKYNTSPKDKLIFDLLYIEQFSIWLDIKLMLQTIKIFFKKESVDGFDSSQIEFIKNESNNLSENQEDKNFVD